MDVPSKGNFMNTLKCRINSILLILFCFLSGCSTPTNQPVATDVDGKPASPTAPYTHHHGWGGKNVHHIQRTTAP